VSETSPDKSGKIYIICTTLESVDGTKIYTSG